MRKINPAHSHQPLQDESQGQHGDQDKPGRNLRGIASQGASGARCPPSNCPAGIRLRNVTRMPSPSSPWRSGSGRDVAGLPIGSGLPVKTKRIQ